MKLQRLFRGPVLWIVAFAIGLWAIASILQGATAPREISYSRFVEIAQSGQLDGEELEAVKIGLKSNYIEG